VRTVDLRQGFHCARALLLQVDLLWITPIDAACIRFDLVPEHETWLESRHRTHGL